MIPQQITAPVRLYLRRVPDPEQFRDFSCFRKSTLSIAVDVTPCPDGTLMVTSPDIPDLSLTYPDFDRLRDELPYEIDPGQSIYRFGVS
ncbi:MAG: hypothetical protein H7840_05715 [Alphaproteobacteria bacterium]